jgi:hypothetical protein
LRPLNVDLVSTISVKRSTLNLPLFINRAADYPIDDTVSEACVSISSYFGFCNAGRPLSSLDRQTSDQAYFNRLPPIAAT